MSRPQPEPHPPRGPLSDVGLSVVVPLYNEQDNVEELCREIRSQTSPMGMVLQLVLVDDGSTDGTWERVRAEADRHGDVLGLRLSRNFGKEHALVAGLDHARGDAIVLMDGDLQHPPALIPEMVARWREGHVDIVEAMKRARGNEGLIKRAGASAFSWLYRRLSGYEIRNASDFCLLSARAAEAVRCMPERTLFFRGMCRWIGFSRVAIEFDVPDRQAGSTGWSFVSLVRLAVGSITAYSAVPLYLVSLIGVAFAAFAALLGAQTIYMFFSGKSLSGFTTVILLLLIIGSAIMLGMSIMGMYVSRIYEEVKQRPRYVCREVTGPSKESEKK